MVIFLFLYPYMSSHHHWNWCLSELDAPLKWSGDCWPPGSIHYIQWSEFNLSCFPSSLMDNYYLFAFLRRVLIAPSFHMYFVVQKSHVFLMYVNLTIFQLRDGSSHQGTVTSMEPNEGTFVLHSEMSKVMYFNTLHWNIHKRSIYTLLGGSILQFWHCPFTNEGVPQTCLPANVSCYIY